MIQVNVTVVLPELSCVLKFVICCCSSWELSQARLWRGIATISNSTDPGTEASVCEPSCRPNPSGCSCPIWKDRFPCRHCCALLLCTKQGCVSNGPWADIIIQTSIVFNQPKVCGSHTWCTIWCTFSPAFSPLIILLSTHPTEDYGGPKLGFGFVTEATLMQFHCCILIQFSLLICTSWVLLGNSTSTIQLVTMVNF